MLRLLHRVVRNMYQHGINVLLVKFSIFVGHLGFWYVLPAFLVLFGHRPMLGITDVLKLALLGHFLGFPITGRFATMYLRCSTEFRCV